LGVNFASLDGIRVKNLIIFVPSIFKYQLNQTENGSVVLKLEMLTSANKAQ